MTYQTGPVTMWFDRRIALRRSPIEGIGTFALEDIPAGDALVLVTGGIVYTTEDWRAGRVPLDGDLYNEGRLGENLFIATPKAFHYYINHSCEPNAIDIATNAAATHYVAMRAIRAGEEITTDYGFYGDALEECRCGSASCRGRVTPDDRELPAVQERLRMFLSRRILPSTGG